MGIAGFYLWLQRHYIDAVQPINDHIGERGEVLDTEGSDEPRDNPRFDNLYLDMNGLIHPCCHDTAPQPEPQSEEEMFCRIFDELDLVFRLVRPRKCLFLAIDGVAPRSKMNQQRSRRFRAAVERKESNEICDRMAEYIVTNHNLPKPEFREKWDHNVITPSTAFMERVGQAVEWFIMRKLNTDPLWGTVSIIFSDAHVPGEGEHKIMAFIRSLRSQPGYDPNTSHCIVGMDADLICLGLATHEANFSVLRHRLDPQTCQPLHNKWCLFNVWKYRQLLRDDFANLFEHNSEMDFERIVDDFVFLCFFVGNDFLPHIPLISIKTKGIETMLDHYVRNWADHGYLTRKGEVKFPRLAWFLDSFTKERMRELIKFKQMNSRAGDRAFSHLREKVDSLTTEIRDTLAGLAPDRSNAQIVSNKLLALYSGIEKEQCKVVVGKFPPTFEYGAPGYREKYYEAKFEWAYDVPEGSKAPDTPEVRARRDSIKAEFEDKVRLLCMEYLRGMQWVMRYYTRGCPSWEWFYPYHYAPLLEDIARCWEGVDLEMRIAEPLHPVEQLLAVLPRESVKALPEELRGYVLDHQSPLARFYPDSFDVDYTEALYNYQGVIRLPFINCKKLCRAARELVEMEPDAGNTLLFCRQGTEIAQEIEDLLAGKDAGVPVPLNANTVRVCPVAGTVALFAAEWPVQAKLDCPDAGLIHFGSPYARPIRENKVRCFTYELHIHVEYAQRLLHGVRERRHDANANEKRSDDNDGWSGTTRSHNQHQQQQRQSSGGRKRSREDADTNDATHGEQHRTEKRRRTE